MRISVVLRKPSREVGRDSRWRTRAGKEPSQMQPRTARHMWHEEARTYHKAFFNTRNRWNER